MLPRVAVGQRLEWTLESTISSLEGRDQANWHLLFVFLHLLNGSILQDCDCPFGDQAPGTEKSGQGSEMGFTGSRAITFR